MNGTVGALRHLTNCQNSNGWVLVTSRQGGPKWPWPLRCKNGRDLSRVDDIIVMEALDLLEGNDPEEYAALFELVGNEKERALGGLPLALAQAGCYISWKGISFANYIALCKKARRSSNVTKLLRELENMELRNVQRTMWTTWNINFKELSVKARKVLCTFALFSDALVPKSLMMKLDPAFSSDILEYGKLVNSSSLWML